MIQFEGTGYDIELALWMYTTLVAFMSSNLLL